MRSSTAGLVVLSAVLAALAVGCGGAKKAEPEPVQETPDVRTLPDWVSSHLEQRDGDVFGLIFGTSDHAPGPNRASFVITRPDNSIVQVPEANVFFGLPGWKQPMEARARLVPLEPHIDPPGAAPHDHPDATDLYVANVRFPQPGRYWFVVEPKDSAERGAGLLTVKKTTFSPAIGSKAIPSDNPTLAEAPPLKITTASPPDLTLLRHSVADSLRAQAPFVVAFATPLFCQTRTCGPAVETLQTVQKRFARSGVRFIHIEVYEDNDPKKGTNRWMQEWGLRTEPWVFVVDRKGLVRAKFEGAVSVGELEDAVRRHLL